MGKSTALSAITRKAEGGRQVLGTTYSKQNSILTEIESELKQENPSYQMLAQYDRALLKLQKSQVDTDKDLQGLLRERESKQIKEIAKHIITLRATDPKDTFPKVLKLMFQSFGEKALDTLEKHNKSRGISLLRKILDKGVNPFVETEKILALGIELINRPYSEKTLNQLNLFLQEPHIMPVELKKDLQQVAEIMGYKQAREALLESATHVEGEYHRINEAACARELIASIDKVVEPDPTLCDRTWLKRHTETLKIVKTSLDKLADPNASWSSTSESKLELTKMATQYLESPVPAICKIGCWIGMFVGLGLMVSGSILAGAGFGIILAVAGAALMAASTYELTKLETEQNKYRKISSQVKSFKGALPNDPVEQLQNAMKASLSSSDDEKPSPKS